MKYWQEFLRTWAQQPAMQIATLSVLVGTFTVIAVFLGLQQNLNSLLTRWGESVQITAYLEEVQGADLEATGLQLEELIGVIQEEKGVERVDYVSKEVAVQRFQEQMGTYAPSLFTDSDLESPLPASLEILLSPRLASREHFDYLVSLAERIAQLAGVEEVSYGQAWVENYASVLDFFKSSTAALVVLLLAGSLLVVGNSIRTSIDQRREEIEILELVGATPAMIRGPYLFEGAMMGLLAGWIALGICALLAQWQIHLVSQHLGMLGLGGSIQHLGFVQSLGLLALAMSFGLLGSYFCVRRISSSWNHSPVREF